jgi:precorrin-6B methylase 1
MFDERLVVVGTGIRTIGQLTMESVAWIRRADKVLYVVSDPVAEEMIKTLNPNGHESLYTLYGENKHRLETYNAMVDKTLGYVREGKVVCMAAYGHPGVFAYPTHESIRRARAEGYRARMLPGVSAEDCLFADIGIDPGMSGCQTFEATDFLVNGRYLDPSTHVVLWQIGVLGDATFKRAGYDLKGMPQLLQKLYAHGYAPQHSVCVYEAPIFPGIEPVMKWIPLEQLPHSGISAISTLYVPPATGPRTDFALVQSLGLKFPTQSPNGSMH